MHFCDICLEPMQDPFTGSIQDFLRNLKWHEGLVTNGDDAQPGRVHCCCRTCFLEIVELEILEREAANKLPRPGRGV